MSFIHFLFLGHFEHAGGVVRFAPQQTDQVYKPVVCRNLDIETIQTLLSEVLWPNTDTFTFPSDWCIWSENGYLICEKYTRNTTMIEFVTHLLKRTGCDMYDVTAHSLITLDQWLTSIQEYSTSVVEPQVNRDDKAAST